MFKFLKFITGLFTKEKEAVIPKGPDGQKIVEGAKFTNKKFTHGYNLNPDMLTDGVTSGRYPIAAGTVLELLQCDRPVGYAPYRWNAWDSPDGKHIGVIWVHSDALTYVSGNFGTKA